MPTGQAFSVQPTAANGNVLDPYSFQDYIYGLEREAALEAFDREQTSADKAMAFEMSCILQPQIF